MPEPQTLEEQAREAEFGYGADIEAVEPTPEPKPAPEPPPEEPEPSEPPPSEAPPKETEAQEPLVMPSVPTEIPEGAVVTERTAKGTPFSYVYDGETYFGPDSTPYKMGHRTETERQQALQRGSNFGLERGTLTPDDTVILLDNDGDPYARYSRERLEKGIDVDYDKLRIPVVNYEGREVLLTSDQATLFLQAGSDRERLQLAKEVGLLPDETTIKEFTGEAARETTRESSLLNFVTQQEAKRRELLLSRLAEYKDEKGDYNIAQALADGVAVSVLLGAGFTQEQIDGVSDFVTYLKASPKKKFEILQEQGDIPAKATFVGIDDEGNVKYSTPRPYNEFGDLTRDDFVRLEAEFLAYLDAEGNFWTGNNRRRTNYLIREAIGEGIRFRGWDGLTRTQQLQVLAYYNSLRPVTVMGITVPKENLPEYRFAGQAAKGLASLIPFVGIALNQEEMTGYTTEGGKTVIPAQVEIAANYLLDALIVASFLPKGSVTRLLTKLAPQFTREVKTVEEVVKSDVAVSRRTLKKVSPKLVKPFDKFVKARTAYTENIVEVKRLERVLETTAGEVVPEVERSLQLARSKTPELAGRLKEAADDFAYLQRTEASTVERIAAGVRTGRKRKVVKAVATAYDAEPLPLSFGDDVARDIETLVARVFEGGTSSVEQIERQLSNVSRQLDEAYRTQSALSNRLNNLKDRYVFGRYRVGSEEWEVSRAMDNLEKVKMYSDTTKAIQANTKEIARLKIEQARLLAQKMIAVSGDANELSIRLIAIRSQIEKLEQELAKTTVELRTKPASERDLEGIIRLLQDRIKVLKAQESEIAEQYIQSVQGMSVLWGEDIPRSSGRSGLSVGTFGKKPPRITGSLIAGGQEKVDTPILLARSPLYTSRGFGAGLGFRETEIRTIEIPGKQTIRVLPQPYWGAVEAPTRPRTKPFERPDFDPQPGRITWTPSVVLSPRLRPGSIAEFSVRPSQLTNQQVEIAVQAVYLFGSGLSTGMSPESASRFVTRTLPGVKMSTESATGASEEVSTEAVASIEISAEAASLTESELQTKLNPDVTASPVTEAETAVLQMTEAEPGTAGEVETGTETGTAVVAPPPPTTVTTVVAPPPVSGDGGRRRKRVEEGSIVWRQGWCWKFIPPPYSDLKPRSTGRTTPLGAILKGRTPRETLQIVGKAGAKVPHRVEVDLGFVDIFVIDGRMIEFKGGGLETDVGTRLDSPTAGMDLEMSRRTAGKVAGKRKGRKSRRVRRDDDFSDMTSLKGFRF